MQNYPTKAFRCIPNQVVLPHKLLEVKFDRNSIRDYITELEEGQIFGRAIDHNSEHKRNQSRSLPTGIMGK